MPHNAHQSGDNLRPGQNGRRKGLRINSPDNPYGAGGFQNIRDSSQNAHRQTGSAKGIGSPGSAAANLPQVNVPGPFDQQKADWECAKKIANKRGKGKRKNSHIILSRLVWLYHRVKKSIITSNQAGDI